MDRAAIEVSCRGGAEAAALAVWRPININRAALGGSGPDRVNGHVCPSCAIAIEAAGAVGRWARASAVVAFVGHFSEQKAQRLRSMLSGDFPPTLPAWGALNQRPNAAPWSHLQKVIDRR